MRTWGDPAHPQLWLLHGWMDVSASFQFLVDAFARDWYVIAPDWRGFGLSEWAAGGYWFLDYLADLDALLRQLAPDRSVNLVGHSMGGNVANLYAGVRPERVRKLALLEGFGLPRTAPERRAGALGQVARRDGRAARLQALRLLRRGGAAPDAEQPAPDPRQGAFLAPHWAKRLDSGEWCCPAIPRHKMVHPVLYRLEEALACWRQTTAPVLWVWGDGEWMRKWFKSGDEDLAERRAAYQDLTEVRVPDCGHMLHHEQPERLAEVLEGFLAEPD